MIRKYGKDELQCKHTVIWQTISGDEVVPEQPVIVEEYTDVLCLHQNGKNEVNVNYGTIKELIAVLKDIEKRHCK